jgi:hypothetical protein
VLQIRDAKGGKDRQVPVCGALRARLAGYHAQVAGQPDRREWFFPGSRLGQPLTLGNVGHNFRRFLWQARISHGGRGHGPRVHDYADLGVMPTSAWSRLSGKGSRLIRSA